MKTFKLLLGIFFTLFLFYACSEDDSINQNDIVGVWMVNTTEGYYQGTNIPVDALPQRYIFNKDGTGTYQTLINAQQSEPEKVVYQENITWKNTGNKLIVNREKGDKIEYVFVEKSSEYMKYNVYSSPDSYNIYVFQKAK